MSRYYLDPDGNRVLKPRRFSQMPDAWVEEPDKDADTCEETYIDERNLFVRCGRFALEKKKGKSLCRKCLNASKN